MRLSLLTLALAASVGCGDVLVNPLHNLYRPTEVLLVTDAARADASPEYLFVLDTDRAQLVLADTKAPQLLDLRPEVPGFDGVLLGGQPTGMAARDDGTLIAVANFGLGVLQLVCTPIAAGTCPTPSVVAEIDVGDAPEFVAISGNHAYVTRPHAGVVVAVNLDTHTLDGFVEVGGEPRGIAVSKHASGDKLWVADGAGTAIHRVTVGSAPTVTSVQLGFPTTRVYVSPAPQWVYAVRRDRGSLFVVEPEAERIVNAFPDGPPNRGPDLDFPGHVMGMGFVTYTAAEARTIGSGQFGWVSSTDGFLYAIYTDGPNAHEIVNKAPPPADDAGVVTCQTADRPGISAGQPTSCPFAQTAPQLYLGQTAIGVTTQTPRIINYDQSPAYGIMFNGGRRVVRNEAWNFTWQGIIDGANPSPVTISGDYRIRSRDLRFRNLVIEATGEPRIKDGDYVVFLDSPIPAQLAPTDGGVDPCATVELQDDGLRRRWKLQLDPNSAYELILTPADGSHQPPLSTCYAQGTLNYEVRAVSGWVVQTTLDGYLGRAGECPRELPDSNCAPYEYRNPWLRLTLKQGTQDSFPDMRWAFQASDGVTQATVSLNLSSSLSGIPKGVAVSLRPTRYLYVVDQADESVAVVDPAEPILKQVLR